MIDFTSKPYSKDVLELAYRKACMCIFTVPNFAAFLANIMVNLKFTWTEECTSARTNGSSLEINPDFFMSLTPKQRQGVILHELWHIARLHPIRKENRNLFYWNIACDIAINNDLSHNGYDIEGMGGILDKKFIGMPEETIYEIVLKQDSEEYYLNAGFQPDIYDDGTVIDLEKQNQIIQNIVQADVAAKANNEKGVDDFNSGSYTDESSNAVSNILNSFLHPKVPWNTLLRQFLTDIGAKNKPTWRTRNRRYSNIYMPGKLRAKNRLDHLIYFLDVSGSINDLQVKRFNSEVRYIKKVFNPRLLSLVQFDTEILQERIFTEKDKFENIEVISGGGTSYNCVHDYIEKHKPTCAIIFTDLYAEPMDKVSCPVIWVAVNTKKSEIPFGKLIKIND